MPTILDVVVKKMPKKSLAQKLAQLSRARNVAYKRFSSDLDAYSDCKDDRTKLRSECEDLYDRFVRSRRRVATLGPEFRNVLSVVLENGGLRAEDIDNGNAWDKIEGIVSSNPLDFVDSESKIISDYAKLLVNGEY